MGTRTVTTVFAVSGEKDYKNAVKNINAILKELNSELSLNAEKWKGNENYIEALNEKMKILQRTHEEQATKLSLLSQAYDAAIANANRYKEANAKLADEISRNKKAMQDMADAGQEQSDAYKAMADETDKLYKAFNANTNSMQSSVRNAAEFAAQMRETETDILKVREALTETTIAFEDAKLHSDGYAQSMDDVGEAADGMGQKTAEAVDAMASALAASGLTEAFAKLREALTDCAVSSIEFESALAGVFKTVDGSYVDLELIRKGIRDLSLDIPATTTELAAVAEAAGQLGIQKDGIVEFTRIMTMLGTATNLTAEDAAANLAKLANITGLTADDYERLGSAIVDLGNNGASTEEEIVRLATRMAATGDIVGMSVQDMLAYAAALSDLGIEAEAGGSAISKLFRQIQNAVEGGTLGESMFDDVAGMNADEFTEMWTGSPAQALAKFIQGLQRLQEEGTSAVSVLNEMGITEVRLSNAILALTASGDLLEEHLNRSHEAWEKNTALAEEAARRYETTESKMTLLSNSAEALKIAIGDDFLTTVKPSVELLTDLTQGMAEAAEESPALSSGLAGIGGAAASLTGLSVAAAGIKAISTALGLFGTAAGPVAATVTVLGGIASAVAVYHANVTELTEASEELISQNDALMGSVERSRTAYDDTSTAVDANGEKISLLIDKVSELSGELNKTPADQKIVQAAVDELNKLLPGLGLTYDGVTGKINLTREAMARFATEAEKTAKIDALEKYLGELNGQMVDLEVSSAITNEKIEEAQSVYDDATDALRKYTEGQNLFQKALNYTSPEFLAYKEAAEQAENELKQLAESQSEIETAISDVNRELETAKALYDEYTGSLETMAEAAALADEAMKKMQHHAAALDFERAAMYEGQFYRAAASSMGLGGGSAGAGFMIAESGGVTNHYNITIPARDIREFNDIIRIAEGQKQSIRMGYAKG